MNQENKNKNKEKDTSTVRFMRGGFSTRRNGFTLQQLMRRIFGNDHVLVFCGDSAVFKLFTKPSKSGRSTIIDYELAFRPEMLPQTVKEEKGGRN